MLLLKRVADHSHHTDGFVTVHSSKQEFKDVSLLQSNYGSLVHRLYEGGGVGGGGVGTLRKVVLLQLYVRNPVIQDYLLQENPSRPSSG